MALGATHRDAIDAPAGADDVPAAAAFARARMLDVVAVRAPFFSRSLADRREPAAGLTDIDPALLGQARREFRAAIEVAARFRAPRVVVHPGRLPAEDGPRSEAVERLCRELWEAAREASGLRIALAMDADANTGFGNREFGWVFGELEPGTVGLVLDCGVAERRHRAGLESRESWAQDFSERLEMLYLSDSNEFESGLPLGAGLIDPSWIERLRSRELPAVLKLSEGISRLGIEESLRQLGRGAR